MTQNSAVVLTREEKEVAYLWGDYIPHGVFRVGDLFLLQGDLVPPNRGTFLLLKPVQFLTNFRVVLSGLVFSETGAQKVGFLTIYLSDFPTNIRFVSRL